MTLIEFKKLQDYEQLNWLKENVSRKTDLDYIWNNIYWISRQKFGNEEVKKEEKSKKRKRPLKVPLSEVKDLNNIKDDEEIVLINFYSTTHNKHEYIIDMYKTNKNNFYTNITDVTNGYKEISVNEMKQKSNIQLTLDFFNI